MIFFFLYVAIGFLFAFILKFLIGTKNWQELVETAEHPAQVGFLILAVVFMWPLLLPVFGTAWIATKLGLLAGAKF